VLFVSLRDLQWRRRRFLIGVLATGLVFALTVVMSGVNASFHNEVNRTVNAFAADKWIVPADVSGPFTSTAVFPMNEVAKVRALPGVESAEPVAFFRATVKTKHVKDLNLIGIPVGGMVNPKVIEGRGLQRSGDLVVDKSLGVKLGQRITLVGRQFTVVGRTDGLTYFAGTPAAFATLDDLQKGGFSGAPLVTAIVVRGSPTAAPQGFRTLTNAEVKTDLGRPMKSATSTIGVITYLLWAIAAGIMGSVLYLQAIERTRDFAVFKATGVTSRSLLWGLAVQASALALCAALTALIVSFLLAPTFAIPVQVPTSAYIALPIVAVAIGLFASLVALRRAVTVDPALAFG
jgi:putative ABC transport system permease protein